jgi:Fe-S-cluster containining protein
MDQTAGKQRPTLGVFGQVDDLLASRDTGFSCRMCGSCCGLDVRMTEHDLRRIESHRPDQAKKTQWIRKNGSAVENGLYSPAFADANRQTHCIFLEGNRCSIHEVKPLQCRLYPFFPVQICLIREFISDPKSVISIQSPSGIEYVISVDQGCRGLSKTRSDIDWEELVRLWEQHEKECVEVTS